MNQDRSRKVESASPARILRRFLKSTSIVADADINVFVGSIDDDLDLRRRPMTHRVGNRFHNEKRKLYSKHRGYGDVGGSDLEENLAIPMTPRFGEKLAQVRIESEGGRGLFGVVR